MSDENLELLHQAFDAFNRRDLDAFLTLADLEIELTPLNLELEGGAYRGHDGVRTFWKEYIAVFPDFQAEIDDARGFGEMTLAHLHLRGHGTASAVPFEQPIWQIAQWRNEKCLWWHSFRSEDDALEAASLR